MSGRRPENADQIAASVAKAAIQLGNGKDATAAMRDVVRELDRGGFSEVADLFRGGPR